VPSGRSTGIGRAPDGRLLLRCFTALILHLAAVEAHGRIVSKACSKSITRIDPNSSDGREIAYNTGSPGDLRSPGLFNCLNCGTPLSRLSRSFA
jgi:hypothetical protein